MSLDFEDMENRVSDESDQINDFNIVADSGGSSTRQFIFLLLEEEGSVEEAEARTKSGENEGFGMSFASPFPWRIYLTPNSKRL